MGFLRARSQTTDITTYSGLQVQTTSGALPVPIVYGRNVLAPNVIWYQNFQSHPQNNGKGGGKGGGPQATSYTYSCDIIMGVCEGPVTQIGNVYQSSPTPTTLSALGLSFFNGASPQATWSYLSSKYPSEALPYSGTCYVAAANYGLGSSASVDTNNFEVYGVLEGTGANGIDADPAQVVYDFLTNAQYGVGVPASSISASTLLGNNSNSLQAYCFSAGIALSPALNSQESAASIVTRWLQLMNATAIWSDGLIKFVPYGDSNASGGGWNYIANVTPLYSLTDEDFIYEGSDPVETSLSDPYAISNWQTIEIQSRADLYNTGPILSFDQTMIDEFGLRPGSSVSAHEICDVAVGQIVGQLILQRQLYVRRKFVFKLPTVFCLLEPGIDLLQISDPSLGPNPVTVRIIEIDEDAAGDLTITAEEFPGGVGTSVVYPTQSLSNGAPNSLVVPAAVNTPVIIEPPTALTNNQVQLWFGVSPVGGDPNWGGAVVYASLDNTSYAPVATIHAAAAQGVTTASLAAYGGSNPDVGDTLSVDLTASGGTLASTTAAAAASGVTLCYVGGEYVAYTTATLTAAHKYNLTSLYRGQMGVASITVPSGAVFCFLDSSILKYAVPNAEIGDIIYFKFASFNIFNQALQDLSTCTDYPYVVSGTGVTGPVTSALSVGTALDFGLVASDPVSETDDWGTVASSVTTTIDLGNCH